MNALLKAAIAWRNADNAEEAIRREVSAGANDLAIYMQLAVEHWRIRDELVLPAKSALHLAIEQAENDSA